MACLCYAGRSGPFGCRGGCAPADLPRIIDLFKGADAFESWLDEFIGDDSPIGCPSE